MIKKIKYPLAYKTRNTIFFICFLYIGIIAWITLTYNLLTNLHSINSKHITSCYKKILLCNLSESENHIHQVGCYEYLLICNNLDHFTEEIIEEEGQLTSPAHENAILVQYRHRLLR